MVPLGFLQANMQKQLILSLQTNCVLYECVQDGQSRQGLPDDVNHGHQATGHSGKPFSPMNCVSLENWTLGVVAPFSVVADGFLSEVSRVSSEHQFSETRNCHFFLQFQGLTVPRGPLNCYQQKATFPDKVTQCPSACHRVGPFVNVPFHICLTIFLVIFNDHVMFYQLDITQQFVGV